MSKSQDHEAAGGAAGRPAFDTSVANPARIGDIQAAAVPEMTRRYNERSSASITLRTREQVARFFDGLGLVGPGLVPLSQWWPEDQVDAGAASGVIGYCGMARKNAGPG